MRKIYFDSGIDYELTLSLKDYTTLLDSLEDSVMYQKRLPEEKSRVIRFQDLLQRLPPITKVQKQKTMEEQKVIYEKMVVNQINVFAKHFADQMGEKLKNMSEADIKKEIQNKFGPSV